MYSPQYAIETNRAEIDQVILDHPFATIVYQENGAIQSFHLPLLLFEGKLVGHIAKANPAWKFLNHQEALFIFHGPNCYISPAWYGADGNVPTWNYISIHIRGNVKILEDEVFLRKTLKDLSEKYDPEFPIDQNIDEHHGLLHAIVGIEVTIKDVFAKFKLAQSKPEFERRNVIRHLLNSKDQNAHHVALAMRNALFPK